MQDKACDPDPALWEGLGSCGEVPLLAKVSGSLVPSPHQGGPGEGGGRPCPTHAKQL